MPPFSPLPLLGNPHVQTVLANWFTGFPRTPHSESHAILLPDGDRIALHETPPRGSHPCHPIALLIHGLGGSHRSAYMVRLTNRLSDLGWRVVRMDLRGAGAGMPLARRYYNAACSNDVRAVVDSLVQAHPQAPLAVIGFSLGGNIALKFAGENPRAPLRAVVAVAPPIDLVRCSEMIAQYPFYDRFYVRHLTTQVRLHQQNHPEVAPITFPRGTTLRMFDDLYTAPRWGYADAIDYYTQASALPWIERVRVPTFLLTARDDPFVAVEPIESLKVAPPVEVHIANHGGHLGFLGRDGNGGIRWGETQIVRWLEKQMV